MKKVVVVGIGGMGRETAQLIRDINAKSPIWELTGYVDDDPMAKGRIINGVSVLGDSSWLKDKHDISVAVGVGSPANRRKVVARLRERGVKDFPTLIHPTAIVGANVEIGQGALLCAGTIITTDARIGPFSILNVGASVSHDAVLDSYATLGPGVHLAGTTRVGEGTELGVGACISKGKKVGAWSIVGAGAVVASDLPDNVTAVGVPAKAIKNQEPGWQNG